ncbi:MAG: tetratricopeptide repeat protein [Candidatus Aminicenantaceae bacterium]
MTKQAAKKSDYDKVLLAYSTAMKAFHKGEFQKAVELLKTFLEKYCTEKELVDRAHIYLSICNERLEETSIKLKTFNDYYQYSIYKINSGEYEEALKLLKKAQELNPQEGKIFYLLADVYCLMGDTDNCLEHLRKAIQIDKNFKILAQNERDFESLREDKKFLLITRMK